MREFLRTRYGCDFCKKVGGSKGHMRKHESGCTMNPNRICALHKFAADGETPPSVAESIAALADGGYPKLVEVTHNCPACKLAAMRQGFVPPKPGEPWPDEPQDGRQDFDYKRENAAIWDEWHAAR